MRHEDIRGGGLELPGPREEVVPVGVRPGRPTKTITSTTGPLIDIALISASGRFLLWGLTGVTRHKGHNR